MTITMTTMRRMMATTSYYPCDFYIQYQVPIPGAAALQYMGFNKPEEMCILRYTNCGKSRNGSKEWQLGFRDYLLAVHETQCGSEEARLRRAFKMFDMCKWRRRTWWACTSPQGGCSPKGPSMRRRKPGRFSSDLTYSGNLGVGWVRISLLRRSLWWTRLGFKKFEKDFKSIEEG